MQFIKNSNVKDTTKRGEMGNKPPQMQELPPAKYGYKMNSETQQLEPITEEEHNEIQNSLQMQPTREEEQVFHEIKKAMAYYAQNTTPEVMETLKSFVNEITGLSMIVEAIEKQKKQIAEIFERIEKIEALFKKDVKRGRPQKPIEQTEQLEQTEQPETNEQTPKDETNG